MCEANQTQVTAIHILGFQGLHRFKTFFFIGFLLSYVMTLIGNFLIIILVTTVDKLKIPMFIFLKHLAIVDVLLMTTVVSVVLHVLLTDEGTVSLSGCYAQLYFYGIFGCVQCYLVTTMSYDRYLAICIPLRYASLMNLQVCFQLVFGSWFFGSLLISTEMIMACRFNFCGANYIDHYFCDFGPILELSTSDKANFIIQDIVTSMFMLPLPLALILLTYICISFTILKISSAYGRRKAFSTCSSHLITVCTSYGTLITVYAVPKEYSTADINKYKSLFYILVTPLVNPIIYSLRNKEIKKALHKMLCNIRIPS